MNRGKTKIQTSRAYSWRENGGNFPGRRWSHLKEHFPHAHPTGAWWSAGSKLLQRRGDLVSHQCHFRNPEKHLPDCWPLLHLSERCLRWRTFIWVFEEILNTFSVWKPHFPHLRWEQVRTRILQHFASKPTVIISRPITATFWNTAMLVLCVHQKRPTPSPCVPNPTNTASRQGASCSKPPVLPPARLQLVPWSHVPGEHQGLPVQQDEPLVKQTCVSNLTSKVSVCKLMRTYACLKGNLNILNNSRGSVISLRN